MSDEDAGALASDQEAAKALAPVLPRIDRAQPLGSIYRRIRQILLVAKEGTLNG
ncbi:MAG: hypothetical protein AAFX99_18730 [Myxococcota bacterium]